VARFLGLHLDEVLVVVDLEDRFRGVDDAPDDHGGDLDRVALEVVDLQPRALEIADPKRDTLLRVQRVRPAQARHFGGPDVVAEELEDLAFVRVDDEEPDEEEQVEDDRQAERDDAPGRAVRGRDETVDGEPEHDEQQERHGKTRQRRIVTFANHGDRPPRERCQSDITLLSPLSIPQRRDADSCLTRRGWSRISNPSHETRMVADGRGFQTFPRDADGRGCWRITNPSHETRMVADGRGFQTLPTRRGFSRRFADFNTFLTRRGCSRVFADSHGTRILADFRRTVSADSEADFARAQPAPTEVLKPVLLRKCESMIGRLAADLVAERVGDDPERGVERSGA
jgi:hypothetical protein